MAVSALLYIHLFSDCENTSLFLAVWKIRCSSARRHHRLRVSEAEYTSD